MVMSSNIDSKTKGAWIIHHTNKLEHVTNQSTYEKIFFSGKAGILLSAISATRQQSLDNDRVASLAKAANINTLTELPTIIDTLVAQDFIAKAQSGIDVLGISTHAVLQHTTTIYESLSPTAEENATIILAEEASNQPIKKSIIAQKISDELAISTRQMEGLLNQSEEIGFTDYEKIDKCEKLYFNGNLFRGKDNAKVVKILDSLTPNEQEKILIINSMLETNPCLEMSKAESLLGDELFRKVVAVGLYDANVVANSTEKVAFLTKPSAFAKYSSSTVDDAFDLAKAFLSSLTYGMTRSSYSRGNIQMVGALMNALIRGEPVGPVTAIAEDYKVLEMKGVVKVAHGVKNGRRGPMMKLLKKEVGELALMAITKGNISDESLSLPTAAVNRYVGPETNRTIQRKKQNEKSRGESLNILSSLRKGDI